jgi:hypothetical protein
MLYASPLDCADQELCTMSPRDRIIAIAVRMLVKRGVNSVPASSDNLREAGLTSLDMTPDNFDTVTAIENLVSVTAKAA